MFKEIRVIFIPVIIVVVILLRSYYRKRSRAKYNLDKRERTVYIQQQWLDPVVEIIVVGGVIWSDLSYGLLPWLAFLVGVVIGLPVGAIRGRFMFVRSLGEGSKHKVVVQRNAAEIAILLVLIVIKFAARAISASPTSLVNLLAVGLLAVGLSSSVGRVAYITYRHYHKPPKTSA